MLNLSKGSFTWAPTLALKNFGFIRAQIWQLLIRFTSATEIKQILGSNHMHHCRDAWKTEVDMDFF